MKHLLVSNKGISDLVAYVLLISLTLSISAMVYWWIVFMIPNTPTECPENVNIIVNDYTCYPTNSLVNAGKINLTIQNKGYHTIDGFFIRVSDNPDSTFGTKELDFIEGPLKPGEKTDPKMYNYEIKGLENLTVLEVQPFIDENKGRILCKGYNIIRINCTN
jgi:hypothetical protein